MIAKRLGIRVSMGFNRKMEFNINVTSSIRRIAGGECSCRLSLLPKVVLQF